MATDTIAAIATAPGRGGVAVVRVSGPDAFAVAKRLTGRELSGASFPFVAFSRFKLPLSKGGDALATAVWSGRPRPAQENGVLDEGLLLAFRAPHSYTGEDVVELQCHGGTVSPRRVLEACFAAGARLARRGEFTERAFLNGRLDYGQAESVLDLIDAKTARAADAALDGLAGRRTREMKTLYDEALSISSELEHALDIDEGELPDGFLPTLERRLEALGDRVSSLIRRAREGKILRQGALVVLAGPPNAGKSSLMNALLEENRAIVSDTPGTTRDSIEEWLDLSGWPVRLVDTAGLRETDDAVESAGVQRARDLIARADVVLDLQAADAPERVPPAIVPAAAKAISVTSKCDLAHGEGLNVSARTGEGLDALKAAIVARLEAKAAEGETDAGDVGDAHVARLVEIEASLAQPRSGDLVLFANEVRTLAEKLGDLIGATYSSDLLDRLFSRFCVGK